MPNFKNYKKEELKQKLNKIITPRQYKEFSDLLVDIFLRRAYEFELSDEEILNTARAFSRNIRNVKLKYDCGEKESTAMGWTVYPKLFIKGNIRLHGDKYEQELEGKTEKEQERIFLGMYESLTHEVFHGVGVYLTDKNPDKHFVKRNERRNYTSWC